MWDHLKSSASVRGKWICKLILMRASSVGNWKCFWVCMCSACRNTYVHTYRYAGLWHGDAVWVHRGFHALGERGSKPVRLICTFTSAPLRTAGEREEWQKWLDVYFPTEYIEKQESRCTRAPGEKLQLKFWIKLRDYVKRQQQQDALKTKCNWTWNLLLLTHIYMKKEI